MFLAVISITPAAGSATVSAKSTLDNGTIRTSFVNGASDVAVQRIYGTDAIGTSIAVSQTEFPIAGSATAVVLARSDFFSDALAGGPLAEKVGGPLLITPGTSLSSSLDPRVQAEIQRVLPVSGTVYILGGPLALNPDIDSALQGLGYVTQRVAGSDEYATAVNIAEQLGNPSVIFEATGLNFPDALSAVPAAIETNGAILLTDGTTQAPETASYLAAHPNDTRYAIGGPLVAYGADPTATPVYGQDLYETSAAVASTFFATTKTFGAATGANYPDALSGGVLMGAPATKGPVLLVQPSGPLPPSIDSYLSGVASTLTQGYLFGGPLAVGDDVLAELETPQSTPSLAVVTSGLPSGTVGTPYSATLSASGGTLPYTWAITAGLLPSGLSLSSSGAITGTPSTTGSYSFTVQVTDSTTPTPQRATAALSITVGSSTVEPSQLVVTTNALPSGTYGASYSATLSASGGTPPYTWAITAGLLPSSLSLSSSGGITGIPSSTGSSNFTVQVTDSTTPTAQTATKALSISVVVPPFPGQETRNWSGYVIPSSSQLFTEVSGDWTVPSLNCAATPNAGDSIWVGIGGVSWPTGGTSGVLLQTGVTTNCVNGVQQDFGWWEEFPSVPNRSVTFSSFPVSLGDSIAASVYQGTTGAWETRVDDLSTGLSGVMVTGEGWGVMSDGSSTFPEQGSTAGLSYSGGYTAEWVIEDYELSSGGLVSFADYGTVSLTGLTTSLTSWSLTPNEAVEMVQGGVVLSTPSAASGDGFSVSYTG
jgi:hypothetical protein